MFLSNLSTSFDDLELLSKAPDNFSSTSFNLAWMKDVQIQCEHLSYSTMFHHKTQINTRFVI